MGHNLRIDFGACFYLALGTLLLPADWFLCMLIAACFHESCHYLAAKALKVGYLGVQIGAGGMRMTLAPMGRWEELWIAAAGPAGSFLLLFLVRIYPQIAICALVQGLFNLIPIWPLDGGRILRSLFADNLFLSNLIEISAAMIIFSFGLWMWRAGGMGIMPIFLTGFILTKVFLRKIPCIEAGLGVQ